MDIVFLPYHVPNNTSRDLFYESVWVRLLLAGARFGWLKPTNDAVDI